MDDNALILYCLIIIICSGLLRAECIHEVEFASTIFVSDNLYRFAQSANASVLNCSPPYTGPKRNAREMAGEISQLWKEVIASHKCKGSNVGVSYINMETLSMCPAYRKLLDRTRMLAIGVVMSHLTTEDQRKR
jgi:hypothetical protein